MRLPGSTAEAATFGRGSRFRRRAPYANRSSIPPSPWRRNAVPQGPIQLGALRPSPTAVQSGAQGAKSAAIAQSPIAPPLRSVRKSAHYDGGLCDGFPFLATRLSPY